MTFFLPLTEVFAFARSCFPTLSLSRSCLASLYCVFAIEDSSVNFLSAAMARLKSTTRPIGVVAGCGSKGHESKGSAKRTESMLPSDTIYHSGAGDDANEGSHTRSYYFGPSTITVSHIRGMIDHIYFSEGMVHETEEETIVEPNADEVVDYEEFFTAGLRMPLHPVLADIL
jgi:hypothetical protein